MVLIVLSVALFGDNFRSLFSTQVNALSGAEEADRQTAVYGHRTIKSFGYGGGGSPGPSSNGYGHKNLKSFGQANDSQAMRRPNHARPPSVSSSAQGYESGNSGSRPDNWGNAYPVAPSADPAPPPDPMHWNKPAEPADPAELKLVTSPSGGVVFHQPPPSGPVADKNKYYENNYHAGAGERERMEKLVAAGVVVDGKQVRLGAFTRSYHQNLKVPGRSALALSAELDHAQVLTSGGEVFLQVAVQASKREMSRRPPLNIALVIDRSGSMAEGDKMVSARKAALRFIDDLRADDRAIVVAYDDQIEIAGRGDSRQDKQALRQFIGRLSPRGATNIHGALDAAYRALADNARPGLINTVLLMSDGLPTAGNTSVKAIVDQARAAAEAGISTTTVGMGLDYNDALMMGVAQRGQGHYHFVKDPAAIEPIFKAEFASLNRVVARALKVRIVLADDVVLRRVLGSRELSGREKAQVRSEEKHIDRKLYEELGIQADREQDDQDGIRMMIPYFFSGDSHVVLLQLWVPPGQSNRKLASVTLKYKDMLFSKNGMDEADAVVGYVDSTEQVVASISRPVKKNLLGMRAGEAMLGAAELVASGQNRRAADMIATQARFFEEAGRAWNDSELTRDAKLLGHYRDVVLGIDHLQVAGRDSLRSYLSKTLSHSGYKLVQ